MPSLTYFFAGPHPFPILTIKPSKCIISFSNLPENISKKLKLMVLERKKGKETVISDKELNEYIELIIKDLQKKANETAAIDKNIEEINQFFYDIISNEIIDKFFYDIISN